MEETTTGSLHENDDTMGLGMVEDGCRDEQRRLVERINIQTKQGTIKNFCTDMRSLGGAVLTETGGGSKRDGMEHSLVEPRLKEAYVTNRYGVKTKGFRKKAIAKRSNKMGPKSKTGKEPVLWEPDSNQQGIRSFFSSKARPEPIGTPMGFKSTLHKPAFLL